MRVSSGTNSGVREIYFDDLTPDSEFHGLEWAQEIQFAINEVDREGFGIGIHRLELIP